MKKESAAAALYWTWRESVDRDGLSSASREERRQLVESALAEAIETLEESQGADWSGWR